LSKNLILFVALESEFPRQQVSDNLEIYYTGVGKVNAAIKATQVLVNKSSDNTLVLNYGSAGTNSLAKNSLFKCNKFEQLDIDARPLIKFKGVTPYDNLIYPAIPATIEFGADGEICSTADQFQEKPPAAIVDMEAYSIAKVCKILNFDFISYKYISDDGSHEEWESNHMNGQDLFMEILKQELL
jgi:adenosylhomocysteine nucleosidase